MASSVNVVARISIVLHSCEAIINVTSLGMERPGRLWQFLMLLSLLWTCLNGKKSSQDRCSSFWASQLQFLLSPVLPIATLKFKNRSRCLARKRRPPKLKHYEALKSNHHHSLLSGFFNQIRGFVMFWFRRFSCKPMQWNGLSFGHAHFGVLLIVLRCKFSFKNPGKPRCWDAYWAIRLYKYSHDSQWLSHRKCGVSIIWGSRDCPILGNIEIEVDMPVPDLSKWHWVTRISELRLTPFSLVRTKSSAALAPLENSLHPPWCPSVSTKSSGWWLKNNLEKYMSSSMGRMTYDDIPYMKWKNKSHVPNHQPVILSPETPVPVVPVVPVLSLFCPRPFLRCPGSAGLFWGAAMAVKGTGRFPGEKSLGPCGF